MAAKSPYSPELRRRAVHMVGEVRPQYRTEWEYRPELIDGFLAQTGLTLEPDPP